MWLVALLHALSFLWPHAPVQGRLSQYAVFLYSWKCFFCFQTARALIGYVEVTWHLTMKLFPAKISERASLQNLWRQRVTVHCCPLLCRGNIEILGGQKLTVALETIFRVLSESVTERPNTTTKQTWPGCCCSPFSVRKMLLVMNFEGIWCLGMM